MADLRALLTKLGLTDVQTYLQSGNVVFSSSHGETRELEHMIGSAIQKDLGYEVQVLVLQGERVSAIVRDNPFLQSGDWDLKRLYYLLFIGQPKADALKGLLANNDFSEKLAPAKGGLYLYYADGYGRSKINSNYLERRLGVWATARNHNTMKNLDRMVQEQDLL